MAGIGIRLNRIFNKNSIAAKLFGFGYSVVVTIAADAHHYRRCSSDAAAYRLLKVRILPQGTVFLYGTVYLHLCIAYVITFQCGNIEVHVGCYL